jgi:hydrogenase maturation protein HypF
MVRLAPASGYTVALKNPRDESDSASKTRPRKAPGVNRRMHVTIRGAVQGVGFRPFVYRLATDLGLKGWVNNSPQGVFLEVEGLPDSLSSFLLRIDREKPPRSFIQSLEHSLLDPVGFTGFEIRPSSDTGVKSALVLPDIAPCPDCLREIFDPTDRRYLYPFTNCTNCGPRFSILRSLPYDRPNTTMAGFTMCSECRTEYEDPRNRRFHAQPNACPVCGPQLELWNSSGTPLAAGHEALIKAATQIRDGKVVALKGVGGFQLLVDGRNPEAIATLRRRKHREEKPFAVMAPDLATAVALCEVGDLEARLLQSPEAPIVLLRRRAETTPLATEDVAPGNPFLGFMLPSTPLHHILLRELRFPVIATSGNISDEPICIDEYDALARLGGIADVFLIHNRPIHRHVDDSVVRIILGRELVMRRARGYAPLPVSLDHSVPDILAVGSHLKNTVAVCRDRDVFISQHIGDLETEQSMLAFQRETASLQDLFGIRPSRVVSDLHPGYLSTKAAGTMGLPVLAIQHHWAHVASCMAENGLQGNLLGVSWDGTGYGSDATIWGGEFLVPEGGTFRRAAHLRTFRLPGGEAAIKEPRRSAAGILFELGGSDLLQPGSPANTQAFSPSEILLVRQMLERQVNAPLTSSAGRLFDAVASLLNVRQECSFEGQAAMELEYLADRATDEGAYPFTVRATGTNDELVIDWGPMVTTILQQTMDGTPRESIALRFHNTLAMIIVRVAEQIGLERVALTGGCFQNSILTERTVRGLEKAGFRPYWHQRVPPNDGGISLGQIKAATLQHEFMGRR